MASASDLLAFADQNKLAAGVLQRAAISRAYYAAFHALQASIAPMVGPGDVGAHGCAHHGVVLRSLRTWASSHPDRAAAMRHGADAIKCYHRMVACKEARERADYDLRQSAELSAAQAVNIVGKADRIVKDANMFLR